MHSITRLRPSTKLLTSSPFRPLATRHTPALLSTPSVPKPYSTGGYGNGEGDPRAERPAEQGEVDPATEKIEHPGTKPTKPSKPAGQQQPDGNAPPRPSDTHGQGKPTMKDDWNDVSNEATNLPPERQSEEVKRHNEDVVHRHDKDFGRDQVGGREGREK